VFGYGRSFVQRGAPGFFSPVRWLLQRSGTDLFRCASLTSFLKRNVAERKAPARGVVRGRLWSEAKLEWRKSCVSLAVPQSESHLFSHCSPDMAFGFVSGWNEEKLMSLASLCLRQVP
jgi:hypothetical protein